jgi:eukaryotic-like serine/threonine-protein kinase
MLICSNVLTDSGCGAQMPDGTLHCGACGNRLAYALRVADPGEAVGSYRIVQLIGHGGFGAVYLADDLRSSTTRRIALKQTFDAASIRGFRDEFAVLRQLSHDHLPQYFDVFEADGQGYLAMEYVPGKSLEEIHNEQGGPLPEKVVLGYALQLCDVLSFLHERPQPILHRDIKPANIRLTPFGQIKLVDFGLLKQGDGTTRSSRRALTPTYAPIEQYGAAGGTDARTDQYSLAATLYHLLTGSAAPTAVDRLGADDLRAPHLVQAGVSRPVSDALVRGMALKREERWPSVAELRAALLVKNEPPQSADLRPSVEQAANRRRVPALPATTAGRLRLSEPQLHTVMPDHLGDVNCVVFSPNNRLIASASGDRSVRIWRVSDGESLAVLSEHTAEVRSLAFSPSGRRLISGSWDSTVRIWDADSLAEKPKVLRVGSKIEAVAVSPDGNLLAVAGFDRSIRLWQIGGRGLAIRLLHFILHLPVARFGGHKDRVRSVTFDPSGELLASAADDGSVIVRDLVGAKNELRLDGHKTGVNCVRFSPDGTLLATAGDDGTVRLWSADSGSELQQFNGHLSIVRTVAFSPDGSVLASGSGGSGLVWNGRQMVSDNVIHLWDTVDGSLLQTIDAHRHMVTCLTFSSDGRMLASSSYDEFIHIWQLPN